MFEAVFLPRARAVYAALSADDRAAVDRITRLIESDLWADGETKFTSLLDRWAAGVYDDGRWEVVYRILNDRSIEVVGISRITGEIDTYSSTTRREAYAGRC